MAAPDGPDVVGLLHDKTSYGVYGDHGGAQESVQRVPMVFWTPGMRGEPDQRVVPDAGRAAHHPRGDGHQPDDRDGRPGALARQVKLLPPEAVSDRRRGPCSGLFCLERLDARRSDVPGWGALLVPRVVRIPSG